MNIAIVGYGKMGKLIKQLARSRGHSADTTIDPTEEKASHLEITEDSVKNSDLAIEFTRPDAAVNNIKKLAKLGKNVVVGTTGWYDRMAEVKDYVESSGTGLIYGPNFSVGINAFLKIVEEASKLINKVPEYDAFGYELHHNKKSDSPSGTAKAIAETMLDRINRKKIINYDKIDGKIKPEELHYASVRAGSTPGTHIAAFDSEADTIELKHTARNRSGFAIGALIAAEWINGKKGFFEMNDMMSDFFNEKNQR